jgi:hypothetical protein
MPIVPHDSCIEPADETVICRFIEFWKFRDLFANEELYLRRVDLFKETDPQEGLPSDEYARKVLGLHEYDLHDELMLNSDQAFNRQHSEGYYLMCWQLFEGETMHMWNTYGHGVAVFSQFGLLKAALNSLLDPILAGVVRYKEKGMRGYNLIDFLFRKRQHFHNERELRVLLQSFDPLVGMNRHLDEDNFPHREPLDDKNRIHPWVHQCKRRRIDLRSLITEVRFSPQVTQEQREAVELWVKVKNFTCRTTLSDLTSPHTPTPDELKKIGM